MAVGEVWSECVNASAPNGRAVGVELPCAIFGRRVGVRPCRKGALASFHSKLAFSNGSRRRDACPNGSILSASRNQSPKSKLLILLSSLRAHELIRRLQRSSNAEEQARCSQLRTRGQYPRRLDCSRMLMYRTPPANFKRGSLPGTHCANALGVVKPCLVHPPRAMTLCLRQS